MQKGLCRARAHQTMVYTPLSPYRNAVHPSQTWEGCRSTGDTEHLSHFHWRTVPPQVSWLPALPAPLPQCLCYSPWLWSSADCFRSLGRQSGKKWVSGTQCRGPPYRCRRGDPAPRHWHLGLPSLGSSTLAARWCSANVTAASRLVGQWHRTHLAVSTSLQWSRRQPSCRCVV